MKEYEEKKTMYTKKLEDFIYNMHGKYVNEEDFTNGKEGYKEFVDLYMKLYYEPLVEEFDESKYFTMDYEKNL